MIKENVYYEVESEEEAKWIIAKMYEDVYHWIESSRETTYYYSGKLYYMVSNIRYISWSNDYDNSFEVIKVSTLMTPSKVSAYAHNVNVEVGDFKIKRTHGKYINVYGINNMCIDQIRVENPKLKEIMVLYGVELLDTRTMTFGELVDWCDEQKSVKSLSVDFESSKVEILMKSGCRCEPIDRGIVVI